MLHSGKRRCAASVKYMHVAKCTHVQSSEIDRQPTTDNSRIKFVWFDCYNVCTITFTTRFNIRRSHRRQFKYLKTTSQCGSDHAYSTNNMHMTHT
jgi:hypothetical protein